MYNQLMNQANPKLNSADAGIAFSANVVLYIFASLIVSLIVTGANIGEETDAYKYLSYLAAPVALAAGSAFIMLFRKQTIRDVAPIKCGVKYYVIAALLIFGLLFSVSGLNVLTLEFLKLFGYTPREESSYLPSLGGGLIVPALLVIAVLPAVMEEFLFRGIILSNTRASTGDIRAIFIVGFCFALFHASPEQTIYQFICGCVFAFLAVRSGSVLPCVLMHFANNALIIILYACGATDANGSLALSAAADIAVTVLAAVAFVGGIVWLALDKKPLSKGVKGGVKNFFITAWVGVAILAVVWILSFFIR